MSSQPEKKEWRRPRKLRGLGDLVAIAAKPIAAASDALLGTHLQNCQSCEERRQNWNKHYPFGPNQSGQSGQ